MDADVATGQPKRRTFKKFSFRGVDLDALLDMKTDELVKLFSARARRRYCETSKRLVYRSDVSFSYSSMHVVGLTVV